MYYIESYVACKSKRIIKLYKDVPDRHYHIRGKYTLYKCKQCGLIFLNPMLTASELDKCYSETYYSYVNFMKKDKRSWFKKLYDKITLEKMYTPGLPRKAKILDIGCGSGKWLYDMKQKGYIVSGCEVSETAAKTGKETAGIDIFPGQLIDSNYKSKNFDYIRMHHSFEHIYNPNETLQEIKRILKDNGRLYIAVPNIDSWWGNIFKQYWYYLGAPIHVYNYSKNSLMKILEQNGFKVTKIKYNGVYNGLTGSIQILVNSRKTGNLTSSQGMIISSKVACILGTYISKIANLLGRGDCIEIIAKKIK